MIHALPGMGADHRMYSGEWLGLPNFVAHDWSKHHGETTLAEIAKTMCEAKSICDGDVLVGSSLGGMVACEITKIRRISALFLVGSAVDRSEVSHLLTVLGPLAKIMPLDWLKTLAGNSHNELMQMFSGVDPAFIRAMCDAIFKWQGLGVTQAKVHRIHGIHDWVISIPAKVDLELDGGHLIAMTHEKECVEYIGHHIR